MRYFILICGLRFDVDRLLWEQRPFPQGGLTAAVDAFGFIGLLSSDRIIARPWGLV